MSGLGKLPGLASDAVLKQSIPVPEDFQEVKGLTILKTMPII